MIGELDAIRALLATTGHPHFFGAVDGTAPANYYLVWSSGGSPGVEQAVDAKRADIDDSVGVTAVAGTTQGVLIMQKAAREALVPGRLPRRLTVAGRLATLHLTGSRPIDVDRDVTNTATGKHPAFGVDMYRLISTPDD